MPNHTESRPIFFQGAPSESFSESNSEMRESQKEPESKSVSEKKDRRRVESRRTEVEDNEKDQEKLKQLEADFEGMKKSPDLDEAVEKLRSQMEVVKKFFDGSLHQERIGQKNSVVMISELESDVDALNKQIEEQLQSGKKFRVVDAWGAINGMEKTPDEIALRFPRPGENWKKYVDKYREGAMYSGQSMYLSIDEKGVRIVDYEKEQKEPPAAHTLDSLIFALKAAGKENMQTKTFGDYIYSNGNGEEYWRKIIVERAEEYGCDVYLYDEDLEWDNFGLIIDLQSGGIQVEDGRYLHFNVYQYRKGDVRINNRSPHPDAKLQ